MQALIEHARAEFRLDLTQEGGCSLRAQLQQVQASTGQAPAELCTPPCPVSLAPLFQSFVEMASARSSGFGAPQPIGWADMQAWSRMTQTPVTPFEARVLRLLDAAWVRAWVDGQPKDQQAASPPRKTPR